MAVAARMSAVFTGLFYKSRSDLPPLLALTLFEEFKELTPPGEEGDAVILNLAERLVEIDLLDRAAGVLETQVEFRLKGQARARVAARLAAAATHGSAQNPSEHCVPLVHVSARSPMAPESVHAYTSLPTHWLIPGRQAAQPIPSTHTLEHGSSIHSPPIQP